MSHNLAVAQTQDMAAELRNGARYLDVRIGYESASSTKIVLRHLFGSSFYLSDLLEIFAKFIEKNPKEILILDISNDYLGDNSPLQYVPDSEIESIVLDHIDSKYILSKDSLSNAISEYGGIYFTGFKGTSISTLTY